MMQLQMISFSSISFAFHPSQIPCKLHSNGLSGHLGSLERFKSPLSAKVSSRRLQRSKHSIIKCSFQNSIPESSLHKNHKPLKSIHPLALQRGFASNKSEDESTVSTTFVDVLSKKFDALLRLTRPYTWASIVVGIVSVSLLPIQNLADLTPAYFMEVAKSIVPAIMMNNFVNAINQLSDIEIDKVNKPHLPLASGDFSLAEGIAIAIASPLMGIAMGAMLRSPPLVIGYIIWWVVGAAYSIDLPLLRWKGSPLMAAVTIIILNGLLLQIPYFIHFQKYVLGRPVVFSKPLLFAAAFMPILNVAIAFTKDLPDVEGDIKFGLRTLPIILGRERVFSISNNMLLVAYGVAALLGASSSFLPCKLIAMIGHSALAAILWSRAQTVDLTEPKSMQAFYMFIFKLYYAEFVLMHSIR